MVVAKQAKNKPIDVTPVFTLKDIGSKIIDQLSTDVYTGAGAILRELVKNAYDSYLSLDPEDFESETFTREVVISRAREVNGTGTLFIADRGIGQSFDDLKANVQISISRKPDELDNATGFRGLGSWAVLGAGSKVIITSSKKGDPFQNQLTIDVKRVYGLLSPSTTLDDILNNKSCIRMTQVAAPEDEHYTTVEIVCDGPVTSVNGHEINRLYDYTAPEDTELRRVLVQHCPIPYPQDGDVYRKIHEIYEKIGYHPTSITLDGVALERRLPEKLTAFDSVPLHVGDKVVAVAWKVHDPSDTGMVSDLIDEDKHNLSGASIQLCKLNVPIGAKRIYNDQPGRENLLNWYVGEVHILAQDIQPNAGGDGLRSGTAREAFVAAMKSFYSKLEDEAEEKSRRISLARLLLNARQAATKLDNGGLSTIQVSAEKAKVGKAVEVLNTVAKRSKPTNQRDKQTKEAAKDSEVAKELQATRKVLQETGLLAEFNQPPTEKAKPPKKATPASKVPLPPPKAGGDGAKMDATTFQARVGLKIPKLQELGLTSVQIEGVLAIIQELFEGA